LRYEAALKGGLEDRLLQPRRVRRFGVEQRLCVGGGREGVRDAAENFSGFGGGGTGTGNFRRIAPLTFGIVPAVPVALSIIYFRPLGEFATRQIHSVSTVLSVRTRIMRSG